MVFNIRGTCTLKCKKQTQKVELALQALVKAHTRLFITHDVFSHQGRIAL